MRSAAPECGVLVLFDGRNDLVDARLEVGALKYRPAVPQRSSIVIRFAGWSGPGQRWAVTGSERALL